MKSSRSILRIASAILTVLALTLFVGCSSDDDGSSTPVNRAPVITTVTVSPTSVLSGGSALVTVVANDPDNNAITYSFQVSGGSIPSGPSSSPAATWTAPTVTATTSYNVIVTVSDGSLTATGQGTLTVTAPATQTGISGSAVAPGGVSVDLRNSLVRLFTSYADWQADRVLTSVTAQGNEFSVSFSFPNLAPGTYYLDFWKDIDNDTNYSAGDIYGVYGTCQWPNCTLAPILVTQGNMNNVGAINLFLL
jgi:uncharacterized protein (DUF2141 family)